MPPPLLARLVACEGLDVKGSNLWFLRGEFGFPPWNRSAFGVALTTCRFLNDGRWSMGTRFLYCWLLLTATTLDDEGFSDEVEWLLTNWSILKFILLTTAAAEVFDEDACPVHSSAKVCMFSIWASALLFWPYWSLCLWGRWIVSIMEVTWGEILSFTGL